ncbi:alpha/beta hydrolase [Paraburkholderia hospita]|uniref:alpha/beta hydrolase n=1 Tax=Paraburkholderia hospita TaxID=169430 RepID=UPI000DEF2C70|nr:alpha/beta hydrolase [Paraburkholderia hospita]AXF05502.1 alpha/beta hydrolase [Paraburkholderia hospita]
MDTNPKHTYVLIAGAWFGGWVWRDVIPGLRNLGHAVTAPTLTGLGERRHNGTDDTDLSTHIDDVIAHIEMEGLQSVTLVGWSYGGMVVTGVTAKIPDKIKSLIYLDAYVPEDGKALVDYAPANLRAKVDMFMNERESIPPFPLDVFGETAQSVVEFVTPRLTVQPWRTFYEPVQARIPPQDISIAYVYCSGYQPLFTEFYEKFKDDPRVRTAVIDTGHLCMLSTPLKTIEILAELA